MSRIAEVGSVGLGSARGFARTEHDFYPTDAKITEALVSVETFKGPIWEPACGDGAMARLLPGSVVGTDLIDRGYGTGGISFLETDHLRAQNIVTNPPFNLWLPFAKHALSLKPEKLCLLGRLLLLEGWERSEFFKSSHLARVWVVGRAKMLPPGVEDKGFTGMICFAWYVWEKDYVGPTSINWKRPEK